MRSKIIDWTLSMVAYGIATVLVIVIAVLAICAAPILWFLKKLGAVR